MDFAHSNCLRPSRNVGLTQPTCKRFSGSQSPASSSAADVNCGTSAADVNCATSASLTRACAARSFDTPCRRMDEVRQLEQRATVEDLMYAAVLEKFLSLGVDMLGNMDNIMEKVTSPMLPVASTQPCPGFGCTTESSSELHDVSCRSQIIE